MLLYSMSKDQLKKVWDYFDENLKRIHKIIKVISKIPDSVCTQEEWYKMIMCQL
jgi:galactose-1-phosphate uridylyltransferase